jgi:hypothetical protein
MGKKSRFGSEMIILGVSKKKFGVKILKFFDADADSGISLTLDLGWKKYESGMEKIRFRDEHPGWQHCLLPVFGSLTF